MLRFIVKRERFDAISGMRDEAIHTLLIDVPELEGWLTGGGHGPSGYDYTRLIGVEVNPTIEGADHGQR